MALILYLPVLNKQGIRLYEMLEGAAANNKIELYGSIEELSERLHQPIFDIQLLILLVAGKKDLHAISSLADSLNDMRIILILPDHDQETIAKGHLLRPRAILWFDQGFEQLETILKRMLIFYENPLLNQIASK